MIDLEDGCGAMKLTTASYWRPSGKNIHRPRSAAEKDEWGVQPERGLQAAHRRRRVRQVAGLAAAARPATTPTAPSKPPEPFVDRQRVRAEEIVEKEVK